MTARQTSLLCVSISLLAGCGSGSRGDKQADLASPSAQIKLVPERCTKQDLGPTNQYVCPVKSGETTRWYDCTPEPQPANCVETGAPRGVRVFTTPAQQQAPKDVTFKCEDQNAAGRDIGPVFISLRNDPTAPAEQLEDWVTKDEARKVARRYGVTLGLDC